jgi:hypothetical protein
MVQYQTLITTIDNRLENLSPRRAQKLRSALENLTRDDPILPYGLPFQQCLQQQAMRAIVKKMWDA